MLPALRDDQAGDARADALWMPLRCQQADFRIGVGPVAAPQEVAGVLRGAFNPGEGGSLVGKAPSLDYGEYIRQMGVNGSQEQQAVRGGNAGDRQGADVPLSHHRIRHGNPTL